MLKVLANVVLCASAVSAAAWSYEDQAAWSGACATGKAQTPINIKTADTLPAPDSMKKVQVNYRAISAYTLANNGHTWQVTLTPEDQAKNTISGGPLGGRKYKLWQFHSHWGNPETNEGSEHTINGRQDPVEIHFVHYDSKFATPTDAVNSGEADALSVIGVMMLEGDANSSGELFRILKKAVDEVPTGPATTDITGKLNLPKLLPASLQNTKSRRDADPDPDVEERPLYDTFREVQPLNGRKVYNFKGGKQDWFTYNGGLTTPGCFEIVRWILLNPASKNNAITINDEALDLFYSFKTLLD